MGADGCRCRGRACGGCGRCHQGCRQLFGLRLESDQEVAVFYARNLGLFVLPFLAVYFVRKRWPGIKTVAWLAAAIVAAALFANAYPFAAGGNTEILTALHLPIVLWLVVGVAYAGGRWGQVDGRMDFIRFSGELLIYYVLIALGGGVFAAFITLIFLAIEIDADIFVVTWLLPCGRHGRRPGRLVVGGGQTERDREQWRRC